MDIFCMIAEANLSVIRSLIKVQHWHGPHPGRYLC